MNIDLTHPEVLTIEQLKKYLIKFVGSDDITNDKYELIQLFYKYIAPLPQRKFRTNRLGTILTQNQRQFGGEKRPLSPDIQNGDKISKSKSQPPIDGLNDQPPQGEKHESDRGIYTITMQKSANKNTAPIKLKRPTSTTTTTTIATSDEETTKRIKLDDTNA